MARSCREHGKVLVDCVTVLEDFHQRGLAEVVAKAQYAKGEVAKTVALGEAMGRWEVAWTEVVAVQEAAVCPAQ